MLSVESRTASQASEMALTRHIFWMRGAVVAAMLACFTAPGARSFPMLATGLLKLAHRPGDIAFPVKRLVPAFRNAAVTLHAKEDGADPDANLSKEEKLKKYQRLAVEMVTKAGKMPPGCDACDAYVRVRASGTQATTVLLN